MTKKPKLTFEQKKSKTYCLGLHLAVIRNFIGANALITQGGVLITMYNHGLGQWVSLIINLIQFVAVIFGLVYVQTIMGKKQLFLISIPTLTLINFGLVPAMIYENVTALLMLMSILISIIVLVSVLVLAAEALNTALEYLTDLVSPEWNALAGKVKDVAAGAVLISSVFAAAIGCLIILPKFF